MASNKTLCFPESEFDHRIAAVRREMAKRNLDTLLLGGPENIFYLTGYETQGLWYPQILVIPLSGEPFISTREAEDTVVWDATWLSQSRPFQDTDDPIKVVISAIKEFGLDKGVIGYEKSCYFLRADEQEGLIRGLPNASFLDASGLVEQLRVVKSDIEIELMQRVAKATQSGMAAALNRAAEGVYDSEVAADIYQAMLAEGGHYPSMAPFVVSGPRSYVSHATWRHRRFCRNEYVFLEISATIHRYNAPMMRTVYLGDPTPEAAEAEKVVRDAQAAAFDAIRPGVTAGHVDKIARTIINGNSIGAGQNTRVGYSIGIAVSPGWGEGHIMDIKPNDSRTLQENMTFHLIPFIQIPGICQVGLSESVRVTKTGCESFFDLDNHLIYKP